MEYLSLILDFIRHIDVYLGPIVDEHGILIYALISLILFCEVGLVVTPFLPGDSMLFAIGAMCATGAMDLHIVLTAFPVAALCGDNSNRFLGSKFGYKVFAGGTGRFFNTRNYNLTQKFFAKYGAKSVAICRFIPFFRAFVPFVAGMTGMKFKTFLPWSILGSTGWVCACSLLGYFFGNIPFVKANFEFVVIGIICMSIVPVIMKMFRRWRRYRYLRRMRTLSRS